jgi:hypothetical protein
VARRGRTLARTGTALLALVVVALLLSWLWVRFGGGRARNDLDGVQAVVRVQVLNGSDEGGVAGRLASRLREGGFHVVEVRNADRDDYFATLVVARDEDPAGALAVARYLGGPPVIRQAWSSDQADVTVVLGSDRSRLRLGQ